jgi:hypothetical protein
MSPKEVHVKAFGHVLFVNNDGKPHQISSDPVTIHTDCPPVNQVGLLAPGERGLTGTLTAVRSCGYHDHLDEFNATWQGRIVIEYPEDPMTRWTHDRGSLRPRAVDAVLISTSPGHPFTIRGRRPPNVL